MMIFLHRYHDDDLKYEYLIVKNSSVLQKNLKENFDHQKEIVLPAILDEWNALRFQDFKKVSDYNSAIFRIILQLKLCGVNVTNDEMLEKLTPHFMHLI